ncbi:MAG: RidA family protein, partial [Chitinophagaceae bacterium]
MNSAEQNFKELGLNLPPAPKPLGVYKPCLIDGKYLYLSGHGTVQD